MKKYEFTRLSMRRGSRGGKTLHFQRAGEKPGGRDLSELGCVDER